MLTSWRFGPAAEFKYLLRDWLQEIIQYAAPGKCEVIEELRK
jgi:hypothetical protein